MCMCVMCVRGWSNGNCTYAAIYFVLIVCFCFPFISTFFCLSPSPSIVSVCLLIDFFVFENVVNFRSTVVNSTICAPNLDERSRREPFNCKSKQRNSILVRRKWSCVCVQQINKSFEAKIVAVMAQDRTLTVRTQYTHAVARRAQLIITYHNNFPNVPAKSEFSPAAWSSKLRNRRPS